MSRCGRPSHPNQWLLPLGVPTKLLVVSVSELHHCLSRFNCRIDTAKWLEFNTAKPDQTNWCQPLLAFGGRIFDNPVPIWANVIWRPKRANSLKMSLEPVVSNLVSNRAALNYICLHPVGWSQIEESGLWKIIPWSDLRRMIVTGLSRCCQWGVGGWTCEGRGQGWLATK